MLLYGVGAGLLLAARQDAATSNDPIKEGGGNLLRDAMLSLTAKPSEFSQT